MTKKEKKDLAVKLIAKIDQKKEVAKSALPSKEHMAQNNHRRQLLQKAKSRKGDYLSGSRYKPHKPFMDPDPW